MSVPDITLGTGAGGVGVTVLKTVLTEMSDVLPTPADINLPLMTNPYSPQRHDHIDLASGVNTLYPDSEAGMLTILPPVGGTGTITITVTCPANGAPIVLPLPNPPPATLTVTASKSIPGVRVIYS